MSERLNRQYLTFTMRKEHFAIEIAKVREVLDVSTLTRIPRMPDYLSGVINLRGNVVPVMDLGLKLGMKAIERTKNTSIMIVEVAIAGEEVELGVLTDTVQMVLDLPPEEVEPVPRMGTDLHTDFIKGLGRHQDQLLIILDINAILAQEGQAVLRGDLQAGDGLLTDEEPAAGDCGPVGEAEAALLEEQFVTSCLFMDDEPLPATESEKAALEEAAHPEGGQVEEFSFTGDFEPVGEGEITLSREQQEDLKGTGDESSAADLHGDEPGW
jgi:purine-binding chemotaxis protein CheW